MLTFKPAFSFCYSSHLVYNILLWQPELRNHLSGRISILDQFNCLLFLYPHLVEQLSKSWDFQMIGGTVCFCLLPYLGDPAVRMGKSSENFYPFLLSSKFCLNFPLTLTAENCVFYFVGGNWKETCSLANLNSYLWLWHILIVWSWTNYLLRDFFLFIYTLGI